MRNIRIYQCFLNSYIQQKLSIILLIVKIFLSSLIYQINNGIKKALPSQCRFMIRLKRIYYLTILSSRHALDLISKDSRTWCVIGTPGNLIPKQLVFDIRPQKYFAHTPFPTFCVPQSINIQKIGCREILPRARRKGHCLP